MSLITALRSPEGAVIAADSQETVEVGKGKRVNIFRFSVQKISPEQLGNFNVAIAGAGDGELIDAFQERFRIAMSSSSATNLKDFKAMFESELFTFYKAEGSMYGRPRITMVVCAQSPSENKFDLWRSSGSRLLRIGEEPCLIGFEEYLYKYVAKELYHPKRPLGQNVLVAVRILELGRQTSRYIDRPYSVVVFNNTSVWVEKLEFVEQVIERTEMFGAQVNDLFISAMDLSTRTPEFKKRLQEFEATISDLRNDYRFETAQIMFPDVQSLMGYNSPYPHLAAGIKFRADPAGNLTFLEETSDEKREELQRTIQQAAEMVEKMNAAKVRQSISQSLKPEQ